MTMHTNAWKLLRNLNELNKDYVNSKWAAKLAREVLEFCGFQEHQNAELESFWFNTKNLSAGIISPTPDVFADTNEAKRLAPGGASWRIYPYPGQTEFMVGCEHNGVIFVGCHEFEPVAYCIAAVHAAAGR